MVNIEIYTRDFCGFCVRAKALLDSKGVAYKEFNATQTPETRAQMIDRAKGAATFPQVFIDNQHIGGCDDLFAIERTGRLDQLLAAQGSL